MEIRKWVILFVVVPKCLKNTDIIISNLLLSWHLAYVGPLGSIVDPCSLIPGGQPPHPPLQPVGRVAGRTLLQIFPQAWEFLYLVKMGVQHRHLIYLCWGHNTWPLICKAHLERVGRRRAGWISGKPLMHACEINIQNLAHLKLPKKASCRGKACQGKIFRVFFSSVGLRAPPICH